MEVNHDKSKLFIEPTIIENVPLDAPVMMDEIFGPILPVISFSNFEEAKAKLFNAILNRLHFIFLLPVKKRKKMAGRNSVWRSLRQ